MVILTSKYDTMTMSSFLANRWWYISPRNSHLFDRGPHVVGSYMFLRMCANIVFGVHTEKYNKMSHNDIIHLNISVHALKAFTSSKDTTRYDM